MPNPFVHVELATTDLGKSREFYRNLFDWKLEDMPMEVGENDYGIGGMMKAPMAYVSVDDLEAATAKAKSLGANVIRDVTPVPGTGSFSITSDPTGAVIGLLKADRQV